jgi:hypothetical protein
MKFTTTTQEVHLNFTKLSKELTIYAKHTLVIRNSEKEIQIALILFVYNYLYFLL